MHSLMDRHDEDLCRRIKNGIRDYRAKGRIRISAHFSSTLDREALHQTARTSETPEPIKEAEAPAERYEQHWWSAELHPGSKPCLSQPWVPTRTK